MKLNRNFVPVDVLYVMWCDQPFRVSLMCADQRLCCSTLDARYKGRCDGHAGKHNICFHPQRIIFYHSIMRVDNTSTFMCGQILSPLEPSVLFWIIFIFIARIFCVKVWNMLIYLWLKAEQTSLNYRNLAHTSLKHSQLILWKTAPRKTLLHCFPISWGIVSIFPR